MTSTYSLSLQSNGRPVTDPRLLMDMRDNNEAAWTRFYAVYWEWLLRMTVSMGVRTEDAKDIVQKTFITLSNHMSEFLYDPGKGRFSGWLLTVVRRNVINHRRSRKANPLAFVRQRNEEGTQTEPVDRLAGPAQYEVIDQVVVNELQRILQESYAELKALVSPEHWETFHAYNIQELPVEEVARRMGLQTGSVYSIDSRLLQELRCIVERKLNARRANNGR